MGQADNDSRLTRLRRSNSHSLSLRQLSESLNCLFPPPTAQPQRSNKLSLEDNLVPDAGCYHTVHGGRRKHITASRGPEPFARITRLHFADDREAVRSLQGL